MDRNLILVALSVLFFVVMLGIRQLKPSKSRKRKPSKKRKTRPKTGIRGLKLKQLSSRDKAFVSLVIIVIAVCFSLQVRKGWQTSWSGPPSWYNPDWNYAKQLTVDHIKVEGYLTDFPVLVSITDSDLAAKSQDDGDDILFTDSDGVTKFAHEIESYDSGTGKLIAHVRLPSLSSTVDSFFVMYYGNPSASNQQNPTGVWDSHFKFVSHMRDEPNNQYIRDSTVNTNDGTKKGAGEPAVTTDGIIDDAQDFDGDDDHIVLPRSFDSDVLTIEAWIKRDVTGVTHTIFGYGSSVIYYGWGFRVTETNYLDFSAVTSVGELNFGVTGATTTIAANTDYYVVAVCEGADVGDDVVIYVNGEEEARADQEKSVEWGVILPKIGQWGSTTLHWRFEGIIDEVRFSDIVRSSEWIATGFNNQDSPSTFLSVSGETSSDTNPPTISTFTVSPASPEIGQSATYEVSASDIEEMNKVMLNLTHQYSASDIVNHYVEMTHMGGVLYEHSVSYDSACNVTAVATAYDVGGNTDNETIQFKVTNIIQYVRGKSYTEIETVYDLPRGNPSFDISIIPYQTTWSWWNNKIITIKLANMEHCWDEVHLKLWLADTTGNPKLLLMEDTFKFGPGATQISVPTRVPFRTGSFKPLLEVREEYGEEEYRVLGTQILSITPISSSMSYGIILFVSLCIIAYLKLIKIKGR